MPWAACIGAVLLAWVPVALSWPASGDGQVFLWLADLVAHDRGVPYRDAFETKGPMSWLPLVPVVWAAGQAHAWTIRVVDIAFGLAGTWACGRLGARWHSRTASGLAALLHAAWWATPDFWNSAQPDAWAGAWIACAIALVVPPAAPERATAPGAPSVPRRAGTLAVATAGMLVGAAAMIKPFYVAFLAVPALLLLGDPRRVRQLALLLGGGGFGVVLPMLLLARLGALDAWLACLGWTATVYAGKGGSIVTRIPALLLGVLQPPWGAASTVAAGAVAASWSAGRRLVTLAAVTWLGGVLATVFVQGRFWPYHWAPLIAPLAVWGGIGVAMLLAEHDATGLRVVGRGIGVVLAIAAIVGPLQHAYRWATGRSSMAARATWEAREFRSYGRQSGAVLAITDSLLRKARADDRVLAWGFYPGIGPLLGHRAASRLAIIVPLFEGAGTRARDSLRTAFVREMTATPPRWWLLATPAMRDRAQEQAAWRIDSIPGLRALLDTRYRVVTRTAEWTVHERQ